MFFFFFIAPLTVLPVSFSGVLQTAGGPLLLFGCCQVPFISLCYMPSVVPVWLQPVWLSFSQFAGQSPPGIIWLFSCSFKFPFDGIVLCSCEIPTCQNKFYILYVTVKSVGPSEGFQFIKDIKL